jgi:hypothetical protein
VKPVVAASERFTANDLDALNLALKTSPDVAQAARVLKAVTDANPFPIADHAALQKVVGNQEMWFGPAAVPAQTAISLLPNYYFPIESAEDLAAKMADFRRLIEFPEGQNLTIAWAKAATALPPGEKAPAIVDEELFRQVGWRPGRGPSVGGLTKGS